MAAVALDAPHQPGQVRARVNAGLTVEPHTRHVDERDAVDELRIEAELGRQLRVSAEIVLTRRVALHVRPRGRRMQIRRHPLEAARDPFGAHELVNLRDCREPCIPRRARVIAAERVDELAEAGVGHRGQVRRRVPGVATPQAIAIEQRHRATGGLEQIRGSNTDDTAADDADVDANVAVEPVQHRERDRVLPVRHCIHGGHFAVLRVGL